MNNENIRKSISVMLAEIEVAELALGLPKDLRPYSAYEASDALEIIRRIEARLASNEPRPPVDVTKFKGF